MNPVKKILPVMLAAVVLAVATAVVSAAAPTAQDKDNYERLLAIILSGSKENQKLAKDTLHAMGEVGITLLKADCKDIEGTRGALAWSLLKESVADSQPEVLRDFARKGLIDTAKSWRLTYTAKHKSASGRKKRLGEIVDDYVSLLVTGADPKDFELLLKVLEYSLIVGEGSTDYGKEFDTWQKIWTLLAARIKLTDDVRMLDGWQKVVDGHFRNYSLLKNYVDAKTIQAYHAATLQFIGRINELRRTE